MLALLLVSLCSCLTAPNGAPGNSDQWPGFLGAGAKVDNAKGLPLTWSPDTNVAWKVDTPGHGQSSPVVWNGRIFVTMVVGPKKDECVTHCYDLEKGTLVWAQALPSSDPVESSVYVSRAAPTPVVDGERVISFFESGDLVAYSHDGKMLWKRSLVELYGRFKNKFGLSGSLAQTADHVFVLVDDEGPSYLLGVDKKSGEVAWKKDRTERASWSSPAIVSVKGIEHLVVSSAGPVVGYDPKTGAELWTYDDVGGNTGTTPIDMGNGRFFIAAGEGRDGKNVEIAKKSNACVSLSQVDGKWTAKMEWLAQGATPSWASPIEHRGCAYWVNRVGVIFCFDAETGKLHYKERTKQSCWATPFPVGDRIYFFGKDGLTTVIEAGPTFKVLAENMLWDPEALKADAAAGSKETTPERQASAAQFSGPIQYGYAVADGNIVVRIGERLYCLRQAKGS